MALVPVVERGACLIGARDGEVIAWCAVAGAEISGSDIRAMMLEAVEARFGGYRAPQPVEMLSGNGSPCTAKDILAYIGQTNAMPQPFIWTRSADTILAGVGRFCQRTSSSDH